TQEGGKLELRPQKVLELIEDISSLKIPEHSSDVNKAKSDLAKIEQTLQNLTNDVLTPIISKISTFIDKVSNFDFKKILNDIVNSIKEGISGAFDGIKNVGSSVVNAVGTGAGKVLEWGSSSLSKLGEMLGLRGVGNGSDDFGQFK
ncbi:DUF759 family protein, partial [Borreliella afzelii]